jgi:cell division protein FtsB
MAEENIPPTRKRRGQLSGVQITFAAILAIGLALVISLSSRILAGQPLEQAYDRVVAEIDQLKQEQSDLISERDYVRSDGFVESWARDEGKMIREGEVLVVPVPSGANIEPTATPPPYVDAVTVPPEPDSWTLWWALFFDSDPPDF